MDNIEKAVARLKEGGLVAFPTETVYGLGGNALSDSAVAEIYAVKGRPSFNPLIVHVASVATAQRYVTFNDKALKLAKQFWPGPLTLVLPRMRDCAVSLLSSAGMDTLAIRIPAHPLVHEFLKIADVPVAAPSANRSGRVSPTTAEHVRKDFGDGVLILDGGPCAIGIESTVVDMSADTPTLLRHGAIMQPDLEAVIGRINIAGAMSAVKSPGMLERHYAPDHPLRLNADSVRADEALLAFGVALPGAAIVRNLSASRDLKEAAANLFRMLRELDVSGAKSIAAMPVPEEGLGIAINDRLHRAAS